MIKKIYNFEDIFTDDSKNISKINLEEITNNGSVAVVDQSRTYIAGYVEEQNYNVCKNERIIFGDHTRIIKYVNKPFITGADGVKTLKLKDEKKCLYKFYYYYLQFLDIPNNGYSRHFKYLKEKVFCIPSIEFQKSVVETMERIENLIDSKEMQKRKFEELIKSLFAEMLDNKNYPQKRIDEVATLKSGTTFSKDFEEKSGDLLYCKVSDMNLQGNEKYMISSKTYVKKEVGLKLSIPAKSVIFPKRGGAIGTNKKRITVKDTCVDLNTMGVTPKEMINIQYLYYYFINIDLATICDGAAIPQLNNKNIGPLKILIPPLEIQNVFERKVNQIDKQKEICSNIIDKLYELKKAKMQEYFGGEINE